MPPSRGITSSEMAPRRKMRKGTHSCFECRRRKVRCLFSPDRPTQCAECFARGVRCIDQQNALDEDAAVTMDQRKNLRDRVARLEALVGSLCENGGAARETRAAAEVLGTLRSEQTGATRQSSFASTHQTMGTATSTISSPPVMTLFDNAVFTRADRHDPTDISYDMESGLGDEPAVRGSRHHDRSGLSTPPSSDGRALNTAVASVTDGLDGPSSSLPASARDEEICKLLLAALPPSDKLFACLHENGLWWGIFRRYNQNAFGEEEDATLPMFASRAIACGQPPLLGLLLLCYGRTLGDDEVMQYVNLVDRLVLNEDDYAATLPGLECSILKGKILADFGQPRKAWIAARRALMFAQLMGLHRENQSTARRDNIWWRLLESDRFLSLLLGLPHGVSNASCNLSGQERDPGTPLWLRRKLTCFTSQILDRAQDAHNLEQGLSGVLEMDVEIERIAMQMPASWWTTSLSSSSQPPAPSPPAPPFPRISNEAGGPPDDGIASIMAEYCERTVTQMAYHQIRVYLHLPYMLRSPENPRYEYSRTACLSAAREMLRAYQPLRPRVGYPLYECRLLDFVGFTAAVLLLLGLLGYGRTGPARDLAQDARDWEAIEASVDIFKRASQQKGGTVAQQSYRVLEMLTAARSACGDRAGNSAAADHDDEPARYPCAPNATGKNASGCSANIVIPYFGTVSIKPGTSFRCPSKGDQSASPYATSSAANDRVSIASPSSNSLATPSSNGNSSYDNNNIMYNSAHASTQDKIVNNPNNSITMTDQRMATPEPNLAPADNDDNGNNISTNNMWASTDQHPQPVFDPTVVYDGTFLPNTNTSPSANANNYDIAHLNGLPVDNSILFSHTANWLNVTGMDIDQDWSWLLPNNDKTTFL